MNFLYVNKKYPSANFNKVLEGKFYVKKLGKGIKKQEWVPDPSSLSENGWAVKTPLCSARYW